MQVDIDPVPDQAGLMAGDFGIDDELESRRFLGVDRSKPRFRGDGDIDVRDGSQCRVGIDGISDIGALDDRVADAFCLDRRCHQRQAMAMERSSLLIALQDASLSQSAACRRRSLQPPCVRFDPPAPGWPDDA